MRKAETLSTVSRLARIAAAVSLVVLSVGCAASPTAPSEPSAASASSSSSSGSFANLDSSISFCTDEINRYRAKVGLSPLDRSTALEGYAATAAEHDGRSGVPHQYFRSTNGGGVALAENQLLLWKGYAVNDVIRQGLAQMWAEGAGGSHYQILIGEYRQVGCGIFMNGSEVNVSQDFR